MTGQITQGMQWIGPLSVYARVTSITNSDGRYIVRGQSGWKTQGDCSDAILSQQKEQGVKFAFGAPKGVLVTEYQAGGIKCEPTLIVSAEAQQLFGRSPSCPRWSGFMLPAGADVVVQRLTDRIEVEYEMVVVGLPPLLVLPVLQTYGTVAFEQHHQLSIRVLRLRDSKTLVETDATIDERGRLLAAWADPMLAAEMLLHGGHR